MVLEYLTQPKKEKQSQNCLIIIWICAFWDVIYGLDKESVFDMMSSEVWNDTRGDGAINYIWVHLPVNVNINVSS
jgi:hypothetical protein